MNNIVKKFKKGIQSLKTNSNTTSSEEQDNDLGYLITNLLLYNFSTQQLQSKEVSKYIKSVYDYYKLSTFQINQLEEAHPFCNYCSSKKSDNLDLKVNPDNNDTGLYAEVYNKHFIQLLKSHNNLYQEVENFISDSKNNINKFYNLPKEEIVEKLNNEDGEEPLGEFENFVQETISNNYQLKILELVQKVSTIFVNLDDNMILESLESIIVNQLYIDVFPLDEKRDHELKNIIQFAKVDQFDIGLNGNNNNEDLLFELPKELKNPLTWESAVLELSNLNQYQSPRDKVMCMLRTCRKVSQNLNSLGKTYGADELMNCLVYIVLQSNPTYLYSNLKYLYYFRASNLFDNETSYYYCSLSAAIHFIEGKYKLKFNNESLNNNNSFNNNNNFNDDNNNIIINNDNNLQSYENEIIFDPLLNIQVVESDDDDNNPTYEHVYNNSDQIISELLNLAHCDGSYDSRVRSGLKRFSINITREGSVLSFLQRESILYDLSFKTNSNMVINKLKNVADVFNKTKSTNRRVKMAVATIVGGGIVFATAVLATPVLFAAVQGAIGITIATSSSIAASSIVFGAAGATLSAERMNKITSGIKEFSVRKVNQSFGYHVTIGAIGWVTNTTDFSNDLNILEQAIFSSNMCIGECYSLIWEPQLLYTFYQNILDYKSMVEKSSSKFNQIALKMMQHVILPGKGLLEDKSIIRTDWSKVKEGAKKSSMLLAEEISSSTFGFRPITLIGVSLGARIIYQALLQLSDSDIQKKIENVLLIGSPTPFDLESWCKIRSNVSGRVVNCFSQKDLLLQHFYESSNLDGSNNLASGFYPIHYYNLNNLNTNNNNSNNIFNFIGNFNNLNQEVTGKEKEIKDTIENIENVDVSSVIKSHLDYQNQNVLKLIFDHVKIYNPEKCSSILLYSPINILNNQFINVNVDLQSNNNNNNDNNILEEKEMQTLNNPSNNI